MVEYLTLVAVGDEESGKTDLLLKYTGYYRKFEHGNCLTPRYENNVQSVIVDRTHYMVLFVNTEARDGFEILRRSFYERANCILLCYSIRKKNTFANISTKWCIEVRRYAPFTPIILVGSDIEARYDEMDETVSREQGENLKLLIGAYAFVECSIDKRLGIDEVFIEAIRSAARRLKV